MDTFETIAQRRAVKQFDPNHKLAQVEIDQLLSLAILSPAAFNIQNWRFVLVKNPELRKEICLVGWNQAQVTDVSLLVVLCADLNSWEKQPQRYWRNASFDYISKS